jgi:hypothetical protein
VSVLPASTEVRPIVSIQCKKVGVYQVVMQHFIPAPQQVCSLELAAVCCCFALCSAVQLQCDSGSTVQYSVSYGQQLKMQSVDELSLVLLMYIII